MKRRALLLGFLAAALAGVSALAAGMSEADKIERLIEAVGHLANASFNRNGTAHDARAAADHLRLKLREAGGRVRTADDFIRLCGTRSSMSGQAYLIEFADGRRITSESFLRARLKEMDGASR